MKKIGVKFKSRGKILITVEKDDCEGCYFHDFNYEKCKDERFNCISDFRSDEKNVIFKLYEFKFGKS